MSDQHIKPIKLCVNITIPTIDDDSISLYEAVGILANKMQEAIKEINAALETVAGAYSENNPPPYPVKSVNRAETKDVVTVFEPKGGGIEDLSQAELIAACKAGARLGAFNQDDGTCRLYHFNLFSSPERVEYSEIAGGSASGVVSVNDQTGAVNIFEAPINAAKAEQIKQLRETNPYNLLDNSYFIDPINQAGFNGYHGSSARYAIDRWQATTGATTSQDKNGLKIITDKTDWTSGVQQQIEAKRFADVMTLAVRGVFPVACRLFVYIGSGAQNFGLAYFKGDAEERTLVLKLTKLDGLTGDEVVNVYISPDAEKTGTPSVIRWAALYEGEYTADTLPPYVPKGYAVELSECLRYYRRVTGNNETFIGYCANGISYAMIPLQTMRISPTVNPSGKFYYTLGTKQGTTSETATAHKANANRVIVKCAIGETGILTGSITPQGNIDITADL